MRPVVRKTFRIGAIRVLRVFVDEDSKCQLCVDRNEDTFLYCLLFIIQHNPHTVLVYELLENVHRATISKHNLMLQSAESTPAQVATGC